MESISFYLKWIDTLEERVEDSKEYIKYEVEEAIEKKRVHSEYTERRLKFFQDTLSLNQKILEEFRKRVPRYVS